MEKTVRVMVLAALAATFSASAVVQSVARGTDSDRDGGVAGKDAAPDVAPDGAVERLIAREAEVVKRVKAYTPLVESYVQDLKEEKDGGLAPAGDRYFLGRAEFSPKGVRFVALDDPGARGKGNFLPMGKAFSFANEFLQDGLLPLIFVDANGLDRERYSFTFVQREELGEVPCLVFDVAPMGQGAEHSRGRKPARGTERFSGRIWVEDRDYNIVRFSGNVGGGRGGASLHWDSWRSNVRPGVWLPAYVYSEEKDVRGGIAKRGHFRSQTRLWGYNIGWTGGEQELSRVLVETAVTDDTKSANDLSPLQAQRRWDREAEDNVLERMQRIGLLAPRGEVDKALDTVLANLEVSNNLNLGSGSNGAPGVRCRVMMTTPLLAFTVGHTIVLSRGLVDVLEDESSLAAVLAQQLGHIVLGHRMDSLYALFDQINVDERDAVRQFDFQRSAQEERAAGVQAMELLQHSPYKERISDTGKFFAALEAEQRETPNLIGANFSKGLSGVWKAVEQKGSAAGVIAPPPPLAIGGRVRVDPWNDELSLVTSKANTIAAGKMAPFEVMAYTPYLTRY